jgi:hypothetical protein
MPWAPIKSPIADLLAVHARIERLRVVEKIKFAELQLQLAGVDPTPFTNIRRALLAQPVGTKEASVRGFTAPPPPPPDAKRPLKHLRVEEHGRV